MLPFLPSPSLWEPVRHTERRTFRLPRPVGELLLIYHVGSISSLVKYHPREQTQRGHLTFLDERWLLCSPPETKQIQGGDVCQRTFQRGHQMGAGVTTLRLRTTVEVDWRPQMNQPDPAIPAGQEISTSAGANSGNEVCQAGAENSRAAWPLHLSLVSLLCPLQ